MTAEYWEKIQAAAMGLQRETVIQLSPEEKHITAVATVSKIFEVICLNDPEITREPLSEIETGVKSYFGEVGTRVELKWGKKFGISYPEAIMTKKIKMGSEIGWVGCDYRMIAADVYRACIDFPQDRKSSFAFRDFPTNAYPIFHQFIPLDQFLTDPAVAIPKIKHLMSYPALVRNLVTGSSHPHWFK